MIRSKPIVSPLGTFKFPALSEPDTSKFSIEKCGEGIYKTDVLFTEGDAGWDELQLKLRAVYDDGADATRKDPDKKKRKLYPQIHPWIKTETDKEGEETGKMLITVKLPATTRAGASCKPILVDAARNNLSADSTPIWGGTRGKVSFYASFYNMPIGSGVSLRLIGAQIIELVSSSSNMSADSAGFDVEEGYEAPVAAPVAASVVEDEYEDDTSPF